MKEKRFNLGMLLCSLVFGFLGWVAAEFFFFSGFLSMDELPELVKSGLYMGVAALFGVTGVLLAELKGKRYPSFWERRVMKKCILLAYLIGCVGSLLAGGIFQYLYQKPQGSWKRGGDNIVFLMDVSGSMEGILEQGKEAAVLITDKLSGRSKVSLLSFSLETKEDMSFETMDKKGKKKFRDSVEQLEILSGTDYVKALDKAVETAKEESASVIMLTDGNAQLPDTKKYKQAFQNMGSSFYAVGFQINSIENPQLLEIARDTGGSYISVEAAGELGEAFEHVYHSIRSQGGSILEYTEKESVWQMLIRTACFFAAGILLGAAYSFIPNSVSVTFFNGLTGLAAGGLMTFGMKLSGGGGAQTFIRLAAILLMSFAFCFYEKEMIQEKENDPKVYGNTFR